MSSNNHCLVCHEMLLHLIFTATPWGRWGRCCFSFPLCGYSNLGSGWPSNCLPWVLRSPQAQTQASLPHIPLSYHQTTVPLKQCEILPSNHHCDHLRGRGCGQSEGKGKKGWRINKARQWVRRRTLAGWARAHRLQGEGPGCHTSQTLGCPLYVYLVLDFVVDGEFLIGK